MFKELLTAVTVLALPGSQEPTCNTNFNHFHEALGVLAPSPSINNWAMVKADRGEDIWAIAADGASVGSVETAVSYGRYADVTEAEKVNLVILALNNQTGRPDLTQAERDCASAQSLRLQLVYSPRT